MHFQYCEDSDRDIFAYRYFTSARDVDLFRICTRVYENNFGRTVVGEGVYSGLNCAEFSRLCSRISDDDGARRRGCTCGTLLNSTCMDREQNRKKSEQSRE